MKVPYLDLPAEFDRAPVWSAIKAQLETGWFVGGPVVEQFEQRFAELCGVAHAVGVNSGTDALFLVFKALGIDSDDEVITVSNSFIASAGAIAACGARPVFVDVGPDYQMDPECFAAAITPRTKAVVPVHLTGQPAPMERILAIASDAGIPVVEDAAQAVGAEVGGRRVGGLGLAGAFSLHPLKNLNVAGDGGVVTTNSSELALKLRRLRNHGLIDRNEASEFGFNSRLDAIQAAVGLVIMERLEEITARRTANAARYDTLLTPLAPHVTVPPRPPGAQSVFHTYVILCERRDALREFLAGEGVETKIHYPVPIHLQGAGRALGYGPGDLPVTEAQAPKLVTLPVNQHLTPDQIEYVADRVRAYYAGAT